MICFLHIANTVRQEAFMIVNDYDIPTQPRGLGAKFQETLSQNLELYQ